MSDFKPHGSLTGRVRYRQNWRGKLILQVEFRDSVWLGEVVRFNSWRDATIKDIYTGAFYGNMPSEIVRDAKWPQAYFDQRTARSSGINYDHQGGDPA